MFDFIRCRILKLMPIALCLFSGHTLISHYVTVSEYGVVEAAQKQLHSGDSEFARAYDEHAGNLQLHGRGTVIKLLPDDNDGSRHQRFIIRLSSGQTLLVSHNIDLASRISSLKVGDSVSFFGQYEWNNKGGLIHWTHKDPDGSHVAGWIMHNGKKYH